MLAVNDQSAKYFSTFAHAFRSWHYLLFSHRKDSNRTMAAMTNMPLRTQTKIITVSLAELSSSTSVSSLENSGKRNRHTSTTALTLMEKTTMFIDAVAVPCDAIRGRIRPQLSETSFLIYCCVQCTMYSAQALAPPGVM